MSMIRGHTQVEDEYRLHASPASASLLPPCLTSCFLSLPTTFVEMLIEALGFDFQIKNNTNKSPRGLFRYCRTCLTCLEYLRFSFEGKGETWRCKEILIIRKVGEMMNCLSEGRSQKPCGPRNLLFDGLTQHQRIDLVQQSSHVLASKR